jgi:glycosyltransferase involved in cell wall biosynthesis
MNILHLHEQTEIRGGAEVYISQLQELLPKYGHSSFWLGIEQISKGYYISQFNEGIIFQGTSLYDCLTFLDNFIIGNRIDLINIHNIYDTKIIEFCLDKLPVVKFCHSPVMVCPGKQKFWRYSEKPCTVPYGLHCLKHIYTEGCSDRHPKRIYKAWNYVDFELNKASKRYCKIVVMSDFIKRGLIELDVNEGLILCNPYFTHTIKESFEPIDNSKRLLFVGRLTSSKGPHLLLKMFSRLLLTSPDFSLDFVGDGPMKLELVQEVQRLGLEDRVVFKGWQARNEIEEMLKKCYLLIFPSVYPEAFGITGIEAMMHGKPVIGFDVGGVSTWLQDGVTGFLIEQGDIESMREKVEILKDQDLYSLMSRNSYHQALEKFIPEIHMGKLLELYSQCIA